MLIYFATQNQGKVNEVSALLQHLPIQLRSLLDEPDAVAAEETGSTLDENAILKAERAVQLFGRPAFADDTGLFVEALDGQPGIHAARYSGPDATYDDNNRKLLAALAEVPDERRFAEFRCVIAFLVPDELNYRFPDGYEKVSRPGMHGILVRGVIRGVIARERSGDAGFGYDPLFYIPSQKATFAELNGDLKNQISHRGQAIRAFVELLKELSL